MVPKAQGLTGGSYAVVVPLAEALVSDAVRLQVQLSALGPQTALVAWHLSARFSVLAVAAVTVTTPRDVELGGAVVLLADLLASLQAAVGHRCHVPCSCYGGHFHLLLLLVLATTPAPLAWEVAAGQGERSAGQCEKDADQSCSRCQLHACLRAVGGRKGFGVSRLRDTPATVRLYTGNLVPSLPVRWSRPREKRWCLLSVLATGAGTTKSDEHGGREKKKGRRRANGKLEIRASFRGSREPHRVPQGQL